MLDVENLRLHYARTLRALARSASPPPADEVRAMLRRALRAAPGSLYLAGSAGGVRHRLAAALPGRVRAASNRRPPSGHAPSSTPRRRSMDSLRRADRRRRARRARPARGALRRAGLRRLRHRSRAASRATRSAPAGSRPACSRSSTSTRPNTATTGLTLQEIAGFRTAVLGAALLVTRYPRVVSYAIRRCEFDDFLLRRAGARVLDGTPLVARSARRRRPWMVNDSDRGARR